jgi:hypothetical protein
MGELTTDYDWFVLAAPVFEFALILKAAELDPPDILDYFEKPWKWVPERRAWVNAGRPQPPDGGETSLPWEKFLRGWERFLRGEVCLGDGGFYLVDSDDDPKTLAEALDATQTGEEFAQVLAGLFTTLERQRDDE